MNSRLSKPPRSSLGAEDFLSLEGAVLAQKYKILQATGSDQLGTLFAGERLSNKAAVSIKVTPPHVKIPGIFPFSQDHPGLVPIREIIRDKQQRSFIIADEIREEALASWIKKGGPFSPVDIVSISCQLLSAIHTLHSYRYVATYVNTDNIYLHRGTSNKITLRLLALPLANTDLETLNRARCLAPEVVIEDGQPDKRSDLWNVGVIMYEMLYGEFPFDGADIDEIYGKILLKDPPFPELAAPVPGRLQRIVARLLKKEPARRYESADDLLSELFPLVEKYGVGLNPPVEAALLRAIPRATIKASLAPEETGASALEAEKADKPVAGGTLIGMPAVDPEEIRKELAARRAAYLGTTSELDSTTDEQPIGTTEDESSIVLNLPILEESPHPRRVAHTQLQRRNDPPPPRPPLPSRPPKPAPQAAAASSSLGSTPASIEPRFQVRSEISDMVTLPADGGRPVTKQLVLWKPTYYKIVYALKRHPYLTATIASLVVVVAMFLALEGSEDQSAQLAAEIAEESTADAGATEDAPTEVPAPEEPSAAPRPAETPEASVQAATDKVTISIKGAPDHAKYYLDGKRTDHPIVLERGTEEVFIKVSAKRYHSYRVRITPDSDKTLNARMKRRSRKSSKKSGSKKSNRSKDWADNPFN